MLTGFAIAQQDASTRINSLRLPDLSPYGEKASTNPMIIRGQLELSLILARQALQQARTEAQSEISDNLIATLQESYRQLRFARDGLTLRANGRNPLPELASKGMQPAAFHIDNAWRTAASAAVMHEQTGKWIKAPQIADTIANHLDAAIANIEQFQDLI